MKWIWGSFTLPFPYLPTISTFHWPVNWAINPSASSKHCIALSYIVLHCPTLYCIVLHYIALRCVKRLIHVLCTKLNQAAFTRMFIVFYYIALLHCPEVQRTVLCEKANSEGEIHSLGWGLVRSTQMPRNWSQPFFLPPLNSKVNFSWGGKSSNTSKFTINIFLRKSTFFQGESTIKRLCIVLRN